MLRTTTDWVVLWLAIITITIVGTFAIRYTVLQIDTNQQPVVRNNIVNQAGRVIAVNEQSHTLCADIKLDTITIATQQTQLAAFTSSHDLKHLSYIDQQTYSDLSTNIAGAQQALANSSNTYDQNMRNPDLNRSADASLPYTSEGCAQ